MQERSRLHAYLDPLGLPRDGKPVEGFRRRAGLAGGAAKAREVVPADQRPTRLLHEHRLEGNRITFNDATSTGGAVTNQQTVTKTMDNRV